MVARTVDTNVALVANGAHDKASAECQIACIDALVSLAQSGCAIVDSDLSIVDEYGRKLSASGQPGVGDFFFRHVLDNQGTIARVRAVDISGARARPLLDAFEHGTLTRFDRSDRKFALASVVGRAPVLVATDSDWLDHQAGLTACGVRVIFVCGTAAATKAN
jgi:hypothetical protein